MKKFKYSEITPENIFKNRRKIHKLSPKRIIHEGFIKCHSYSDLGKEIYEKGELKLLGKKIIISWPPEWETHETGRWSKKMSNKIRYYGNSMDKDIKLIWELHRMQWLPNVANYALKTNNYILKNELIDILCKYHACDLHYTHIMYGITYRLCINNCDYADNVEYNAQEEYIGDYVDYADYPGMAHTSCTRGGV